MLLYFVCFCFLQLFDSISLCSCFCQSKCILSLNNSNTFFLHSFDLFQDAISFLLNFTLNQFDFTYIFVMLTCHKLLKIVSLELQKFLILAIINNQHLISLLFYLLLQIDIVVGGEHQIFSQISWEDDVHDVYLFNYDTIWLEFNLKLCHHLTCEFSLDISYSTDLNLFCEVTDFFIYFFLKQFFKSIRTEIVEEFLYVFKFGFF